MSRIVDVGIDVVDVARMRRFAEQHADRLDEIFTPREIAYAKARRRAAESLAARFAAKEATLKALGELGGFAADWREIELVSQNEGKPRLRLTGEARRCARRRRVAEARVSVSHSASVAVAQVVLIGGARP